ncbi:MAG: hypothetical protein JXD21_00170 [Candidatus Omnitrophica bacterium]|nr:hypothetical protein [Candidatus Omnitrophota bacterium]
MNRITSFIIGMSLLWVSIPLYAQDDGGGVNPYSYRRDFRRMDRYEIAQKQTELRNVLNWALPNIDPGIMKKIVDEQGNVTVFIRGKRRYSVSKDGDITMFTNGMKTRTDKVLSSGERYTYRYYTQDGARVMTRNEFGDLLSVERIGEGDRTLEVFDSHLNLLYENQYDKQGHWMHDLVNNIWTRFNQGRQMEDRRNGKDGPVIAQYFEGEKFGKVGLWKHSLLDGSYARYDIVHYDELKEVYGFDGTLMVKNTWGDDHRIKLSETFVDGMGKPTHSFQIFGDFGLLKEGLIFHDTINNTTEWMVEIVHNWKGSLHRYSDNISLMQRTHYDVEGKPDKVTLITETLDGKLEDTGEVMVEFVYLWEIADMSYDQFVEYVKSQITDDRLEDLNIDEVLPALYEQIKKNEYSGKAYAGMALVFDVINLNVTLYNINNHSYVSLYVGNTPNETVFGNAIKASEYYEDIADLNDDGEISYEERTAFEEIVLAGFYLEMVNRDVDLADLFGREFTYTLPYTGEEDGVEVEYIAEIKVTVVPQYDADGNFTGAYIDMEKVGEGSSPYHMKFLSAEVIEQIDAGARINWPDASGDSADAALGF